MDTLQKWEEQVKEDMSLKNFLSTKEVKEIYRLASNFNLHEEAIKLLRNAINKKRSEEVRKAERPSMVRQLN